MSIGWSVDIDSNWSGLFFTASHKIDVPEGPLPTWASMFHCSQYLREILNQLLIHLSSDIKIMVMLYVTEKDMLEVQYKNDKTFQLN